MTPRHSDSHRPQLSVQEYRDGILANDMAIFPRALTLVESAHPQQRRMAEELLESVLPHTGGSLRVGITGPPGVGKSSLINALGLRVVQDGSRVAVLAVDPSSSVSGGSILGDKTRMSPLCSQPRAFVRPSPAGRSLGGVARATRESIAICEAAGFDVVLVETVGVGQSEVAVADMTDCVLALLQPGSGDDLQAIKRGLLERADVLAVTKADGTLREAAETAARHFNQAFQSIAVGGQAPLPVLVCSAAEDHGIAAVWEAILERYRELSETGAREDRRREQEVRWLWRLVEQDIRERTAGDASLQPLIRDVEEDVRTGRITAESGARRLLGGLLGARGPG